MVTLLDKQVGEILVKLKESGLEKNTLVIFTSDNGPHKEGGAELAGIETPENIDGISFLPSLLGKGQPQHNFMYWEFHELGARQAVRKGEFKLVQYNIFDSTQTITELFDLSSDIGEENDIAGQNPEIVKELTELIKFSRTESWDFPFDVKKK